MAYSYIELWYFKVIKVDVCGSLVLSNSVTYIGKSNIDALSLTTEGLLWHTLPLSQGETLISDTPTRAKLLNDNFSSVFVKDDLSSVPHIHQHQPRRCQNFIR